MATSAHQLRRRSFLARVGATSAVAGTGGLRVAPPSAAQTGAGTPSDLAAVRFAAGLELTAVAVYQVAAERGLLDDATLGLTATFAAHHQDHAGTFNRLLTASGRDAVGVPDQALLDRFGPMIGGAADAAAVLGVAHALEVAAASTYVTALGALTVPATALAVSRILPVEAQHALVLATALARPIDERLPAFETTDASLLEH